MTDKRLFWVIGTMIIFGAAACTTATPLATPAPIPESSPETGRSTGASPAPADKDYRIITLLPRDAIPAIDDPIFLSAEEADLQYEPDELVLGVKFNGEARAYSIPLLSNHEIVNDTVSGVKIAVTW